MATEPVVTIVDSRGRTVCRLRKYAAPAMVESEVRVMGERIHSPAPPAEGQPTWQVLSKPQSRKSRRQADLALAQDNVDIAIVHAPPTSWRTVDGRRALTLPGLTIRWERLTQILDTLAEHDIERITIEQLRARLR